MNRRLFLRLLASSAIAQTIDVEKFLWVPGEKTIFLPSQAQINFMKNITPTFWGVPYHHSDAYTRSWLGFERHEFGPTEEASKTS